MRLSIADQCLIPHGLTAQNAFNNTLELARLADRLGYERYWLAEHHGESAFACSAPEILVARLIAETKRIRLGSGGVLLRNYSPFKVAGVFNTLEALAPGRIDLGVVRAAGAGPKEEAALQIKYGVDGRDFQTDVEELLSYFRRSPRRFTAKKMPTLSPPVGIGKPQVWVLGSSRDSAQVAAALHLHYAFAPNNDTDDGDNVNGLSRYKDQIAPTSPELAAQAILAIGVICADTDAEADWLSMSLRAFNSMRVILSPDDAEIMLKDTKSIQSSALHNYVIGSSHSVHDQLRALRTKYGVDEIIVFTTIYDHHKRMRSYELLADMFRIGSI